MNKRKFQKYFNNIQSDAETLHSNTNIIFDKITEMLLLMAYTNSSTLWNNVFEINSLKTSHSPSRNSHSPIAFPFHCKLKLRVAFTKQGTLTLLLF